MRKRSLLESRFVLSSSLKIRSFRLLLYPDNRDMMCVLKRIKRDSSFSPYYCGIWHTIGKKHAHLVLRFPNPRSWSALCSDLGCDSRFCRPIGYKEVKGEWKNVKYDTFRSALGYLTHSNTPEKELYPVSSLFGAPSMISQAADAALFYQCKDITQKEALLKVRAWIVSHYGEVITPMMFVSWITQTPYMKVINSPWIRNMMDSHNQAVYTQEIKLYEDDLEYARKVYERRKREQLISEIDLINFDDFQEIY